MEEERVANSAKAPASCSHAWKSSEALMRLLNQTTREVLRSYARSITKDDGAAEIIVEDAILKCAERVDPAKVGTGKLLAYLKVVIRNRSFDWLRKMKHQRSYSNLHHEMTTRSAFSEAASREVVQLFKDEVAKIPEVFQQVVTLRIVDQLTFDEIAAKLQISTGTVLSRFFRGKQHLWRWIKYAKAE